jgi:predicted Rossmann fold nucleotide-binding protein DprA/Smf involved in DNA uptake|tara:strand:- start:494 stop:934 length:441 start_codon:yes stop_codon:yes gene_type:complete
MFQLNHKKEMTTKIKIGIVGSRAYTNKKRIKDLIFEIKQKYGNEVEIVSGGQKNGADGFAKKYALEFNLKYVEFPPSHYNWNMHCVRPVGEYNKPYYVSNFFKRNKQIAEYSDIIVAFIQPGVESRGTYDTIRHAEKEKKLVKIIN